MQQIIKNGEIIDDSWQLLAKESTLEELPDTADLIVPLALWLEHGQTLQTRDGNLGVWLDGEEEIESILDSLEQFQLIALRFPAFTDGRHSSSAYLLRSRYGYKGEIRAIGDILRDQLWALKRCGFDAFALREDKDPVDALKAFAEFSEVYQASFDQPTPLFRRRA